MNYITHKDAQRILEACIANISQTEDRNQLRLLETCYEMARELQNAQEAVNRLADRYIENLQRVKYAVEHFGNPGNSCGVVQGIMELEIANGKITALVPALWKMNKALGLVEL